MDLGMIHLFFAFGYPSKPDMLIIAVLILVLFSQKKPPQFPQSICHSLARKITRVGKAMEEYFSRK